MGFERSYPLLPSEEGDVIEPPRAFRPSWREPFPENAAKLVELEAEAPCSELEEISGSAKAGDDQKAGEVQKSEDEQNAGEEQKGGEEPTSKEMRPMGKARAKAKAKATGQGKAKAKAKAKPEADTKHSDDVSTPNAAGDSTKKKGKKAKSLPPPRVSKANGLSTGRGSRESVWQEEGAMPLKPGPPPPPPPLKPMRRSASMQNWAGSRDDEPHYDGMVKLHVYHLAKSVKAMGLPIYHTALEVYGKEYFYGVDGIRVCSPMGYGEGHKLMKPMGKTKLQPARVETAVKKLVPKWPGKDYKLLKRNCQTFAVELLAILVPSAEIPSEYIRFAGEVSKTKSMMAL